MPNSRLAILFALAIACQILGNFIAIASKRRDFKLALVAILGAVLLFVGGMAMAYTLKQVLVTCLFGVASGILGQALTRIRKRRATK